MVIDIQLLINALKNDDDSRRTESLTHMVLESIAATKDNIIMTELMLEMLQRNAMLNRELENKIDEVERLSVTDQLTGAFNRRKFLEVLDLEMDRMVRYDRPFAIVMFDIDHFKNVNDTYGHDIGDFVLKELSRVVTDRLRISDTFARWGGEEFMVLAPETNHTEAMKLAELLREVIETHDFNPVPKLTSSFGVVTSSEQDIDTPDKLTKAVDEALYNAKRTGRNRVVAYAEIRENIENEQVTTE